jgi:lysophospholipase L1-like esterase
LLNNFGQKNNLSQPDGNKLKASTLLVTVFCIFIFFGYAARYLTVNSADENGVNGLVWVGTWSTAPQLVEPYNMPPEPGLSNNTLRQTVRVSIGGDNLRVRFSNEFSADPVMMREVQVAASMDGSTIDISTLRKLKFNHQLEVTIAPGFAVTSDPFPFDLKAGMDLAITIYFGETSPDVTGHPGSRTTSYLLAGNNVDAVDFEGSAMMERWFIISGIDVKTAEPAAAVVVLGNSITDGRGSGINKQNRWPDILAGRLSENPDTRHVAVLNQGIGGNCVLRFCLGPSALDRFGRDVVGQHGVRWLIILHGINDIGQASGSEESLHVANELIAAYSRMIDQAHAEGILVYGATLLPFGKSFYFTDYREAARNRVNEWIRKSRRFDAVIDFDRALRDPEDTLTILPAFHTGDFLHPNEAGYKIMGEAVNLKLFELQPLNHLQ